jgi:hypothetical protein
MTHSRRHALATGLGLLGASALPAFPWPRAPRRAIPTTSSSSSFPRRPAAGTTR